MAERREQRQQTCQRLGVGGALEFVLQVLGGVEAEAQEGRNDVDRHVDGIVAAEVFVHAFDHCGLA